MLLSDFFHARYTWLDLSARELAGGGDSAALQVFVHEAALILACEHEVLRPALLDALVGSGQEAQRERLRDEAARVHVEALLARLPRARTAAAFCHALAEVREALDDAAARAHAWAAFVKVALEGEARRHLEVLLLDTYRRCSALEAVDEPLVRMDLLH